eukprot:1151838-Pelagomonas_calceolata.AAC.3
MELHDNDDNVCVYEHAPTLLQMCARARALLVCSHSEPEFHELEGCSGCTRSDTAQQGHGGCPRRASRQLKKGIEMVQGGQGSCSSRACMLLRWYCRVKHGTGM